jgi:undecaprenyl-diphosphatase
MLDTVLGLDEAIRRAFATHHAPFLDPVMLAFSFVGRSGTIWLMLGAALAVARPARAAGVWRMMLAVGLALVLTDFVVKPTVRRVRPFDAVMDVRVIDERPKTFSFPSGHAASAFAGAMALGRVWPSARAWLWTIAALIALSRVYVGVHYPLDVIAGVLLGLGAAYVAIGGVRVHPRDLGRP